MPRCTLVDAGSRDDLVRMLGALRVPLGSVGGPRMHAAVADDAVASHPGLLALVAHLGDEPAGFVVATLDTRRYWRSLLLRRPALLARVLGTRLGARLSGSRSGSRAAEVAPPDRGTGPEPAVVLGSEGEAPLRWTDDARDVAKIAFIGVLPAFRRRGVGEALYAALFAAALGRGARAVLARIAADNLASLRLHHAAGWRLFTDADGPFAVYVLGPDRARPAPAAPVRRPDVRLT